MDDNKRVRALYRELRTAWEKQRPLWVDIARFVAIGVDPDHGITGQDRTAGRAQDEFVDDPTAALSVNQAGDYLNGIMWGTGEGVFTLEPSRYVLALADKAEVAAFYEFASGQALYHMNHEDSGLHTALKSYCYDQFAFGTAGIGAFPNEAFKERIEENALTFRMYGVDNTVIDEGKSGQVDTVFTVHRWRAHRIVQEFCREGGSIKQKLLDKLPEQIKEAHRCGDYNKEFVLVFGVFPRADFSPAYRGKRRARYKGVWFLEGADDGAIFREEDFRVRPISVARAVKIRGERYGRASGTMLISTIRSANFMLGTAIEIIEKMADPALGVLNNAIFGDSVLDTSAHALTVFNPAFLQNGQSGPTFPLYDVGDPSALVQFLVPYLNEKIATAFKVDALLDFSSAKEMTATESMQRYAIRGKSLAGLLLQQKTELLVPLTKRAISLLLHMGELGVPPNEEAALDTEIPIDLRALNGLRERGLDARIIPESVAQVIRDGLPWYELRWNNELEKLVRTEAIQNLTTIINAITAIASLNPDILHAVKWYQLLADINDNLDFGARLMLSEKEFQDAIEQRAEQAREMAQLQAGQIQADTMKNAADADKKTQEARNAGRKA